MRPQNPRFFFGSSPFSARASGAADASLDDVAWFAANSESHPHPVATKKPNAWGLYDMHGKYADVVSLAETLEYMGGLPRELFKAPAKAKVAATV